MYYQKHYLNGAKCEISSQEMSSDSTDFSENVIPELWFYWNYPKLNPIH